jgi:PAS domain S-box-containing protein
MRVGELARRTGVGVSTLRAWERRFGFLHPNRSPSGQRVYTEADVERVNAVSRLVAEGLTLSAAVTRIANAGTGALSTGEAEAYLLHQVMQAADQGIWVSSDGRTRYANRKMAEMMRCSIDELLARPVLDFHDAATNDEINKRARLGRDGLSQHYEIRLRRADGTSFLAETATTPLHSSSGAYQGAVAVVSDVTERKEAETASRFQAALLDAIGEAVLASSPDGTIIYANPAAEHLFGWRMSDLIGQNGLELLPSDEAGSESQRIHSRLLRKRSYSGDLELTRRDGTNFMAHMTGSPVLDSRGELVGLISILSDNSERNRVNNELHLQEQQQETAALFGARALLTKSDELSVVLTEILEAIRRVLQCDYATLLQPASDSDEFAVRVARHDTSESILVPSGSRSLAGYTALSGKVVFVDNVRRDRRFDMAPRAVELGIISAIAAPVFGTAGVSRVLIAGSTEPHKFSRSSGHFVQSMANVVGVVLRSASDVDEVTATPTEP